MLTVVYNRVVDVDKFTLAFVLLIGAIATGLISVVADSLAFTRLMALWRLGTLDPGWSIILAATALLGSVMLTMVFGHWYLVIPGLSIDHCEV